MTSKKALAFISKKAIQCILGSYPVKEEFENYEKSQKVLGVLVERDTPMKIKHENNGIPYCAVCERSYLRDVRGNQNRFCGYCGQRLDWGETH